MISLLIFKNLLDYVIKLPSTYIIDLEQPSVSFIFWSLLNKSSVERVLCPHVIFLMLRWLLKPILSSDKSIGVCNLVRTAISRVGPLCNMYNAFYSWGNAVYYIAFFSLKRVISAKKLACQTWAEWWHNDIYATW